jgi:uncharacterized protein YecE (DUF72 family)
VTGGWEVLHPRLYLGTSSWSSKDWDGVFYPPGISAAGTLAHYATRFRSVEVDATFYRTPSTSMVDRWRATLPPGFLLAAKVPQVITHEKTLEGCADEMAGFVEVMSRLEDRLGPLLLQFPYYGRSSGWTLPRFLERLAAFLPCIPRDRLVALEIRNRTWLVPPLLDLLRAHGIALAMIDHPWMPPPQAFGELPDLVTAPFCYLRWLGDRHGIETITRRWDKVIVDRARETAAWVPVVRGLLERGLTVHGYFNNHYAGHAPASIALFERTWKDGLSGDSADGAGGSSREASA